MFNCYLLIYRDTDDEEFDVHPGDGYLHTDGAKRATAKYYGSDKNMVMVRIYTPGSSVCLESVLGRSSGASWHTNIVPDSLTLRRFIDVQKKIQGGQLVWELK